MPNRATRPIPSNPPNLELTWIRSSLTALTQRLFAATDNSARSQESNRYFCSCRTIAHHGTDWVRAGNTGRCSVETQPAGALGFWPPSSSNDHASATVTQTRLCEEWPGELRTLPARRNRASIAAQTMLRIPQLALARSLPVINSERARWRKPRSH
jgi:hypothetical protein